MKIKYISDLHFDYKDEKELENFFKLFNKKDTYIIAGDLFNDYVKSLVVIQKLENMQIKGFWVLGNHEFIHLAEPANVEPKYKHAKIFNDSMFKVKSEKDYDLFVKYIIDITKEYKYFKFLHTGIKYNIGSWTIIGDTGWIDLKDRNGKYFDYKEFEWNHVTNWEWVKKQNKKFLSFVNSTLKTSNKTLVVTHHPLYLPSDEDIKSSRLNQKSVNELSFWYHNPNIIIPKKNKVLFIHGHTHTKAFAKNNITNAIGRGKETVTMQMQTAELKA